MNVAKNVYGSQPCGIKGQNYKSLLKKFPSDPAGFKLMLWSFLTYPESVVFLRAPYTRETIETAFEMVGAADLIPQFKGFDVRERTSSNQTRPGLGPVLKPYREFEKLLNAAPAVWRADQPPTALYAYLEKEFKGN
jgi:hypothetical protein